MRFMVPVSVKLEVMYKSAQFEFGPEQLCASPSARWDINFKIPYEMFKLKSARLTPTTDGYQTPSLVRSHYLPQIISLDISGFSCSDVTTYFYAVSGWKLNMQKRVLVLAICKIETERSQRAGRTPRIGQDVATFKKVQPA